MQRPIAVFDSGIGGLCLLKRTRQLLPQEDFLYFADNKNMPYGNKTQSEIELLMKANMQKICGNSSIDVFLMKAPTLVMYASTSANS